MHEFQIVSRHFRIDMENILSVGVLAVQGGFSEHISHLRCALKLISTQNRFGTKIKMANVIKVKSAAAQEYLDGIIIPGGETTAMSIFLEKNDGELLKALRKFGETKPMFPTAESSRINSSHSNITHKIFGGATDSGRVRKVVNEHSKEQTCRRNISD
jgi:hypothetical protein